MSKSTKIRVKVKDKNLPSKRYILHAASNDFSIEVPVAIYSKKAFEKINDAKKELAKQNLVSA